MKFYVLRSDGAYCEFEGMPEQVITDMLAAQGLSCTFIDEATYQAACQAAMAQRTS